METDALQRLAEMLSVTILFSEKIQNLRAKLAGHPQFVPQHGFYMIDQTRKGYINSADLSNFLNNKIAEDVLKRFLVQCNPHRGKLTYLEYLRLIKPYFDTRLAEVVLSRHIKTEMPRQDPFQHLLEEMILLQCIMFAQMDRLKLDFARRHMLNCTQIRNRILGHTVPRKEGETEKLLAEFIKKSGYDAREQDIKYLECYLNKKINLFEDQIIRLLFLPVYNIEEEKDDFKPHKTKPYARTKPDFLKFRLTNGTQILKKENDIDQIQEQKKQMDKLFTSQIRSQKAQSVHLPSSRTDLGITPIKPVVNHYQSPQIDTPFLAGFMLDKPQLNDEPVQIGNRQKPKRPPIRDQKKPVIQTKNPATLIGSSILQNFIKQDREMREEFTDSLQSSRKTESPFRYI